MDSSSYGVAVPARPAATLFDQFCLGGAPYEDI
jgi:hypothetical protein